MYIGKALGRGEDFRFLTGRGSYVDDMAIEGCAHAVFARSPHAHARIAAISTARAAAMPGVLAIITGREWAAGGLGTILPCMSPVPFTDGRPMNDAKRPVFATEKVCFVGDTVAAAIAETRAQAADAAEAIAVEYEALPVVTDVARAIEADAPVIHAALGTNVVYVVEHGDAGAAEAAIAGAHHVSALEIRNRRIIANPMETRCYLGHYDEGQDHYTLWASCQGPHQLRVWLSKLAFGIPLRRIRVVAPDVGGGFGPKGYFYPEQPVVLWASKLVGRPVRFTATRSDAMMTDAHARDHVTKARMGFDREGRILGLAVDTIAGFGGYQSSFNAVIPGGALPDHHVRPLPHAGRPCARDRRLYQHRAHRCLPGLDPGLDLRGRAVAGERRARARHRGGGDAGAELYRRRGVPLHQSPRHHI